MASDYCIGQSRYRTFPSWQKVLLDSTDLNDQHTLGRERTF